MVAQYDELVSEIDEAEGELDAARAQLANAAASEVDAVQGRQECEAELREARKWNETLFNQLRWLSIGIVHNAVYQDPGYRHVAELVLEGETCPVHDFYYPCPSCAIVALEAGVDQEDESDKV